MVSSEEREAIERWRSIGQPGETKEQYLTRVGGTDPVTGKTYPQPKYESRGGELYAVYTPTQTNAVSSSKPTQPLNVVQNAMREVSSPGIQQIEQRRQQSIAYNEASRQNALQNLGVKPGVVSSERKNALQEIIKKPPSGPSYSSKTSTTGQTYVTRTATSTTPLFVSTSGKAPITRTATSTPIEKKPVNFTEILVSPYKKAKTYIGAGLGVTATAGEYWINEGGTYLVSLAPKSEAVGVLVGSGAVIASVPFGIARVGETTINAGPVAGATTIVAGSVQTIGRVGYLGEQIVKGNPVTPMEKGELIGTGILIGLGARAGGKAVSSFFKKGEGVKITEIKLPTRKAKPSPGESRFFDKPSAYGEQKYGAGIDVQQLIEKPKTRVVRSITRAQSEIKTKSSVAITPVIKNSARIAWGLGVAGFVGLAQSDIRLIKSSPGEIPSVLTGGKTRQTPTTKQRLFDQEGMSYVDLQASSLKQGVSFIPQVLIPGAIITTGLITGIGGGGGGERGFSMDIPGFPGGGGFGFGRRGSQFGRGSAYTPSLLGLISNKKASKAFKLQGIYSPGTIRGR